MIIAVGEVQTRELLRDLIIIAKGNNELHEKNPVYGKLIHGDGWGIAYLKNETWHTYKSLKPIYEDEKLLELELIKPKVIILHVRKATVGEKVIENTQPFSYSDMNGDFVFAHNGTIKDDMVSEKNYVNGTSDSAKWFNKILNCFEKNNLQKSFLMENYTSANFILVTPKKIIVGQNYCENPKYCTMKLLKENNSVVVSSEILPTFKQKEWKELDNKTIVEINLADYY
ncbi:hypothetical protein HN789_06480 [archaeon]|nr:hypothetical protein [archaeon]MBT4022790.1 hypothetical protein [archaeon]MBT4273016.1 hypothetical protein [archaeon]MBT4460893.1 hypothetical protein [archaeon]MBT4858109.1 hypothetical protein [archaeon]